MRRNSIRKPIPPDVITRSFVRPPRLVDGIRIRTKNGRNLKSRHGVRTFAGSFSGLSGMTQVETIAGEAASAIVLPACVPGRRMRSEKDPSEGRTSGVKVKGGRGSQRETKYAPLYTASRDCSDRFGAVRNIRYNDSKHFCELIM